MNMYSFSAYLSARVYRWERKATGGATGGCEWSG